MTTIIPIERLTTGTLLYIPAIRIRGICGRRNFIT